MALSRHKIASRVKAFRLEKAKKQYEEGLQARAFILFSDGLQILAQKNLQRSKTNNLAEAHARERLGVRAVKALKIFIYRVRVYRYLRHKALLAVAPTFFDRLKDRYFEVRAERFQESKAEQLYRRNLMFTGLLCLHRYSTNKINQKK